MTVFGLHDIIGSITIGRQGLVREDSRTHTFNADLEVGGNTLNLDHTFGMKTFIMGMNFEVSYNKESVYFQLPVRCSRIFESLKSKFKHCG